MVCELFTIGHSSHSAQAFVALLRGHGIETVADVRSHPWSRRHPQFRKPALERHLADNGVAYVFLGKELGARSDDPRCCVDGRVSYERPALEPSFREGIERLLTEAGTRRTAVMCAERDPLQCHRMILVCREIRARVGEVAHILADGSLETQERAEARLMALHGVAPDMFTDLHEAIERAYGIQARKIAWAAPRASGKSST